MSLDVYLTVVQPSEVYWANITHNLGQMASAAGIYEHLWHPRRIGISKARDLIEPVEAGLAKLKADPDCFRQMDSPNGWGKYEHFVPWIENYLIALKENPDADVRTST